MAGGAFSPGIPLTPVVNEPVRAWDFPIGVNSQLRPRAYEPFGFPALKAFANVELVRMAIETRKDQFEALDWQIKPVDEAGAKGDSEIAGRIKTMTKFWRKPDGVTVFSTWLRELLENLLVLDAPALERRRTLGGQLIGLDVVPGETIEPKVDFTGRRPRGKGEVAYQQVIKGTPWANLTNDDLIYLPRNPRPNHNYGFGPVEQIVVTINTILRRQARQLAYFTEGNIPAGILNAPEGWSPQQIKDFQDWFDARVSGLTAEQAKLLWVPAATKYTGFKDAPLKDDFDEWLARIVAYAFSLPPTPFVKQMNRSTGETDQDRALEEGLEPLKLWAKRLCDGVIQDDFGNDDLEFVWVDTPSIDPRIQSEIDNLNLRNGSATLDEVRDARGQDPLDGGLGSAPMIYTATGAMTLEQVRDASEKALNPVETPTPLPDNEAPAPGQAEAVAAKPAPAAAAPLGKAAPKLIGSDRPKARRHAAALRKALTPILARTGDEVAAHVGMALRGLQKAADDTGAAAAANAAIAAKVAAEVSLGGLDAVGGAAYEDLFEVAYDSGQLALASVGATEDGLTNQVYQRAVDWARARAAELVSLQGDKNIIQSTRDTIRTVIADGLANNTGSDAIAEAVQTSTAFSAERADLIAHTEIATANGQGKLAGWKAAADENGLILQKYWAAEADCCDECSSNEDASPIGLDETFPSGDDAEPGHPNCRCATYSEVVDGDTA